MRKRTEKTRTKGRTENAGHGGRAKRDRKAREASELAKLRPDPADIGAIMGDLQRSSRGFVRALRERTPGYAERFPGLPPSEREKLVPMRVMVHPTVAKALTDKFEHGWDRRTLIAGILRWVVAQPDWAGMVVCAFSGGLAYSENPGNADTAKRRGLRVRFGCEDFRLVPVADVERTPDAPGSSAAANVSELAAAALSGAPSAAREPGDDPSKAKPYRLALLNYHDNSPARSFPLLVTPAMRDSLWQKLATEALASQQGCTIAAFADSVGGTHPAPARKPDTAGDARTETDASGKGVRP